MSIKIRTSPVLTLLVALGACERVGDPLSPAPAPRASASMSASATCREAISYAIELRGSEFDDARNRTTLTYRVASGRHPSISHWTLAFPSGTPVVLGASESGVHFQDQPDPTTGVRGIRFDSGYGDHEVRTVSLTLDGAWSTGAVQVAVKAGNGCSLGTVQGPVSAARVQTYALSGAVYLDVDGNGRREIDEPGIPGVLVALGNGSTGVSAADGSYRFEGLRPGTYSVSRGTRDALKATTPASVPVVIADADGAASFGMQIELSGLAGRVADGRTIGYWKTNLDKAISGTTRGTQESRPALEGYLSVVDTLALAPFRGTTMPVARDLLGANGASPATLLRKQLLASELNHARGAYIGGDRVLTRLFLAHGEFVLSHPGAFTPEQVLVLKDWYDAYNNSHGGPIVAPVP